MIWAVMGIGMLVNTIQGAKMRGKMNKQNAALQQQFKQVKQEMSRTSKSLKGGLDNFKAGRISKGPDLSIHVDYPEQSYKNLNQLQKNNMKQRAGKEGQMRKDFSNAKNDFFKNNHYETDFGSKGKGRLLTDQSGKPKPKSGAETPQHKLVRQHHESSQRLSLANKHGQQMDSLTKQEAAKAKSFLSDNAALLADAGVQAELQKMIVDTKKKALKLQQDQDDERWTSDMPPTKEVQEAVELGLQDLRQMEEQHVESELQSPDHQAILDYEKEFAAAVSEERTKLASQRRDDEFLLDPKKMMARAMSGPPKQRFDEVLPGYLTAPLFQMGIYEV
jgi:hypothetical protein